jgi:hypothetical protein
MGLLEDAIREHLDLKRSRGADPTEIERLEREALGPVRREPVLGTDRLETVGDEHGSHVNSPVEYHDSTAPHWQQDEDFGEHHSDVVPVEEPEHSKRRGFLRRSRGGEHAPRREPVSEPEPPLGWPEHDRADADFASEHFGLLHALPEESHFEESHYDVVNEHLTAEHGAEEHFHEPAPAADGFDEHPQAGGRFEPDYGPPTEVYRSVDETVAAQEAGSIPSEVEQIVAPAPPTPNVGAHHPILDDLPLHEPSMSANGDGPAVGEPIGSIPLFETEAAPGSAPAPASEPQALSPEGRSAPAQDDDPPQLQFDRPPRRPNFSPEPPGVGGSENDEPRRPADSRPGRGGDDLQGTLEFDVAGELEDGGVDEDVLEVTPDFLQDTPEHDRLWFEQRPPKDFDFDG